jgi:hypothetical protein
VDSYPWVGNSQQYNHASTGFLVFELVNPAKITLYTVLQRTATFAVTGRWSCQLSLQEILQTLTVPGFIFLKSSLPPKPIFTKFKYGNLNEKQKKFNEK